MDEWIENWLKSCPRTFWLQLSRQKKQMSKYSPNLKKKKKTFSNKKAKFH